MKMNKRTTVAALALSALALASTAASAQNVSTSATDLILGFQVTDTAGTGGTTDLEVDLGSTSLFTPTTSTFNLTNLVTADLTSTYGSNWATRTDLTWGIAGITDVNNNTFDVTYSGTTPKNASQSTLQQPYTSIEALAPQLGNTPVTANSSKAGDLGTAASPASGIAGSWTSEVVPGSSDFGYGGFTPGVTEVGGGSAGPIGSIDLFGFSPSAGRTPTSATDIGTFSLGSNGSLSFTGVSAAAVPEPSAYALGICAAVLFVVLRRRHNVA